MADIKVSNLDFSKQPTKSIGDDKKYIPKPYKDVAKGMEKQFVQFMLEQMKKSIGKGEAEGTAMNYYNDLLTNKRAEMMTSQQGGMGIQDLILDQVYPKSRRNELSYKAYEQAANSLNNRKQHQIQMTGPQQNSEASRSVENE